MTPDQIKAARAEGYSDDEIRGHLLSHPSVPDARTEGYSDDEILSHMGFAPASALWGPVMAAGTGATFGQLPKAVAGVKALAGQGTYEGNLEDLSSARAAYSKENPLLSTGLEIAGSIPSSLAAMFLTPEVAVPAGLGKLAPLAGKILSQGSKGAVSGALTSQIPDGSTLADIPEGAMVGGGLGAAFPATWAVVKPAVAPAVASAVQAASNLGVKLRPGQFATSRLVSLLDEKLVSASHTDQQLKNFSKVAIESIGETGENMTPQMLKDAKTRMRKEFDQFARQAQVHMTPQLDQSLNQALAQVNTLVNNSGKVSAQFGGGVNKADAQALVDVISDIRNEFAKGNGKLSGEMYRRLTQQNSMLSDLSQIKNGTVKNLGGKIADDLFTAMEAATPADTVQALKTLKDQYKNVKLLEPVVKAAGASGILDPKRVARLKASGDLGTLSAVGKYLPTPTQTGLSKDPMSLGVKLAIGGTGLGMGLGEAYLIQNDPELASKVAAGAGLVALGKRFGSSALSSKTFLNNTVNSNKPGLNPFVPAGVALGTENREGAER